MFGKKDDKDREAAPAAPEAPRQPLWMDIPEICDQCGARVDQAEACCAPRPACRFCDAPLPCKPIPVPEQPQPMFGMPAASGPFAGIINSAMAASMQQANAFFAPGGPAQMYAANAAMSGGATVFDSKAYLRTSGVPGRAKLTNWQDMGINTGTGHVMNLSLDVTHANGGTYPVSTKSEVPSNVAPTLASGMPVNVRVDQADPYTVLVVWD